MGASPPKGLRAPGKRLWQAVMGGRYEVEPDEVEILVQAARTVDELDRLEAELRAGPATVPGSKGQPVPNPLLAEVRSHRVVLGKLLAQLELPRPGEEEGMSARSRQAQRAARARWDVKKGQERQVVELRKDAGNG